MRRRAGFTLIEMLVSVALVLFIMVILTEAFTKGLDSFRTLKALGDMEARLRAAASILRRDLAADHFEGKRRLSDPNNRWNAMGLPREGFFAIGQNAVPPPAGNGNEGQDSDGILCRRQLDGLYFTVKLRGNNRSEFFTANLTPPSGGRASPLLNPNVRSNFFYQPSDARFQDSPQTYSSQWAEVLYLPVEDGSTTPSGFKLYTLLRGQLVIVPDNSQLNWSSDPPSLLLPMPATSQNIEQHKEMSCYPKRIDDRDILYFNNPTDLSRQENRTFLPVIRPWQQRWPMSPLLTDVLSFDVDFIRSPNGDLNNPVNTDLDSMQRGDPVYALRVRIRIWDPKTQQARQITVVHDM